MLRKKGRGLTLAPWVPAFAGMTVDGMGNWMRKKERK